MSTHLRGICLSAALSGANRVRGLGDHLLRLAFDTRGIYGGDGGKVTANDLRLKGSRVAIPHCDWEGEDALHSSSVEVQHRLHTLRAYSHASGSVRLCRLFVCRRLLCDSSDKCGVDSKTQLRGKAGEVKTRFTQWTAGVQTQAEIRIRCVSGRGNQVIKETKNVSLWH